MIVPVLYDSKGRVLSDDEVYLLNSPPSGYYSGIGEDNRSRFWKEGEDWKFVSWTGSIRSVGNTELIKKLDRMEADRMLEKELLGE